MVRFNFASRFLLLLRRIQADLFYRVAAWASEYSLVTNQARALDVVTNSFW